MSKSDVRIRKVNTYEKAKHCFNTFKNFAIVEISNIVSTQLKLHKKGWGPDVEFLMGKNTSIIKALKSVPNNEKIASKIKGNVAIVFFNGDVKDIKNVIERSSRESFAKEGDLAQRDVWVESCITGMTPDKTSYFQVLGIATKITKGKVEIISPYKVLSLGDRVGPSQANLLSLLNIKPFTYTMRLLNIYEDGEFYDPFIIDIEEEDIVGHIKAAISNIAAISLGVNVLTPASVPYELINAYKDAIGLSMAIGFETKESLALLG